MSNDNYYNKKGQEDKSNGKYKPPSDWEDKEEYDNAWEVTKAHQDQNDGKYDPPRKSSEKEIYDKSWKDSENNS
jgi:hypothetical protein